MLAPPAPGGRRRLAVYAGVAVVASGLIVALWPNPSESEGPRYLSAPVEHREVVRTVEATGVLRARAVRVVLAPTQGVLGAVLVHPGDRVEDGQVLAELEPGEADLDLRAQRAAVAAARGRVAEAEGAWQDARAQAERTAQLEGRGQASPAEREKAATDLRTARSQLDVAQAELQLARERARMAARKARRTVVAPGDGVILRVHDQVGQRVGPSGPVVFDWAEGLNQLEVLAQVNEADIASLHPGQSARFQVPAHPEERFSAEVLRLGVAAEETDGVVTFPVWLLTENPERRLLPGMRATVQFEVERAEGLVVRDGALRFVPPGMNRHPDQSQVFKLSDQGLVAVKVRSVLSSGAFVLVEPIEAGLLSEGDRVAVGIVQTGVQGDGRLSLGGGGS